MDMPDPTLSDLGWRASFSSQLREDERGDELCPARVMAVHRGWIEVAGSGLAGMIPSALPSAEGAEDRATVGDWLIVDRARLEPVRILDRINLFKRQAPMDKRRLQLIAANVDTVFVVTSCNHDFNVARLERYLVMAREVGVTPVVVLTKADLAAQPQEFVDIARGLQPGLQVELINGRDPGSVARLAPYCGKGRTVALLGSSGVGKSTMINSMRGSTDIATQPIRENDGKGRHTTTVRQMHRLNGPIDGGWLIDTPGMREFNLPEAADGIAEVFDDITAWTQQCRFTDCKHVSEPGCMVQAMVRSGTLSPARLQRWRKLVLEDAGNSRNTPRRRLGSTNAVRRNKTNG
ncbi:MAG: ribosome small subunit-dependent GTPase A [Novosphingobium sp.]|nr:ribosome small subunit-dependent GTPase A [Novosphingobium sp.]